MFRRVALFLLLPALDPAVSAQSAAAAPPERNHWTVLFYGCSDNDSEQSFCPDIGDARAGLVPQTGIEVFALVDRSPDHSSSTAGFGEDFHDTRLYRLTRAAAERVDGRPELAEITTTSTHEADTGDAHTLQRYLRWARAHHPAERYALIFYSHGNGMSWCPDETNDSNLSPAELTDVLEVEDSLDLVVFDVCSMAGIENSYQWRPRPDRFGIDVVVATPMAGFPFPWEDIFLRIRPDQAPDGADAWHDPAELTAGQFGQLVVEETEQHRRREVDHPEHPEELRRVIAREAMTCIDLREAAAAKSAIDALSVSLADSEAGRTTIASMREQSDGTLRYSRFHVDAYHVATRLAAADVESAVRTRAEAAASAIDAMVIASYGLAHYDAAGGFAAGAHGVHLVLPWATDSAETWRHLSWYRPERLPAGDPGYGHYAWCGDGATAGNGQVENWFELLDRCTDENDTTGGHNGYRW